MDILESNKLIDEFMESKGLYTSYKNQWGYEVWGEYKESNPYHSDWNLLMPVVEKIKSLKVNNKGTDLYNRKDRGFGLYGNKFKVNINHQYTYNGVVEFIKWYNKNYKK